MSFVRAQSWGLIQVTSPHTHSHTHTFVEYKDKTQVTHSALNPVPSLLLFYSLTSQPPNIPVRHRLSFTILKEKKQKIIKQTFLIKLTLSTTSRTSEKAFNMHTRENKRDKFLRLSWWWWWWWLFHPI
jgi:hypothetical protein